MIDGSKTMKKARYLLEFIFILPFIKFIQLFPIWLASNICGFLVKHLFYFAGKFTKDNEKGLRHISMVFPLLTHKEKVKILKSSYQNIGRFIGEYVNQHKMNAKWFKKNVQIINEKYMLEQVKKGCFAFTCHFGNWEIMQRYLMLHGINLSVIYNPLQNPYTNKMYLKQREVNQVAKGGGAMRQLLSLIKQKKSMGILIDQRDKTGELFKFFNHNAKTSTAIQRLCVKHNYKMLPLRCERSIKNGNKFIFTAFPTLEILKENKTEDELIAELTNKSIRVIENWIMESPSNWLLWTYSRWRTKFN